MTKGTSKEHFTFKCRDNILEYKIETEVFIETWKVYGKRGNYNNKKQTSQTSPQWNKINKVLLLQR